MPTEARYRQAVSEAEAVLRWVDARNQGTTAGSSSHVVERLRAALRALQDEGEGGRGSE